MLRIGHGFDIHRLEAHDPGGLWMGGIFLPFHSRAVAHSDGDVVLHAVIDALLGATASGDIGQWFPDTDPKCKDLKSSVMLDKVMSHIHELRLEVGNVDVTVIAEQPKLSPFLNLMRESLAALLQRDLSFVSIKAKTHEKVDAIGLGQAIAAHVVLTLVPIK